ncbi:MAG: hypothetical protein Q9170_003318 [Blastenia crenularia]
MVSQDNLTKPIVVATKVPCPPDSNTLNSKPAAGDGGTQATIELRACSEFTEYAASVQYFNSGSKLQTLQDFTGQPMIFAVGKNDMLNCLIHEPGKRSGWSMNSLSPFKDKVVAFDIFKVGTEDDLSNSGLFLAVATKKDDGWTNVHHAFLPVSVTTTGSEKIPSLYFKDVEWTTLPDPAGKKAINTLYIGTATDRKAPQAPYLIFAGTKEFEKKAATFYIIDPSSNITDPWTPYSPDTSEDIIKDVQPASLGTAVSEGSASDRQDGLWVLSEKADRSDVLFYGLDPVTTKKTNSLSTLRPAVGKVKSMWSSRNPWGFTDLALACEKGVCFLDHQRPTEAPQQVEGLPDTLFTQVVCSELVSSVDTTATAITMFAISGRGELYFIEGKREWATGTITLKSSGLPIRTNVTRVSCQYNAKLDSSELIYAGAGDSQVSHLLRDPVTKCWSDDIIRFPVPKTITRYRAFVTTLSVKSTAGRALGGFSIGVQSQSAIVLINDRSYALSNSSIEVMSNSQGQLVIVAASMDSLDAPTYTFVVTNGKISHAETVHGGQRVMNILSQIKGDNAVSDAKTSTGAAVFSSSDIKGKEGDFKESTQFLGEFPSMVKAVSDKFGDNDPGRDIEFGKDDQSNSATVSARSASWLSDSLTDVTDFLGDALEFARNAIKRVFKVIFKVVAKGLKLVLKLAGKVISFVVQAVGPFIKAIGTFLKEKLGIDVGKLFQWLGLTWDNEKTQANQAILKKSIHQILVLPQQFLASNSNNLDAWFRRLERDLAPVIGDRTPLSVGAAKDPNGQLKNSPLSWLLDNPLINFIKKLIPLSIITEAFTESFGEEFGDDFEVPNLAHFAQQAAEALSEIFKKELDVLLDLIQRLWSRIENVARDPAKVLENLKGAFQDIAHALFDTVENVVKGVWQFLTEMFGLVVTFIEGVWKIPLVTDFYEWFTDQEFSILNAVTYVAVRIFGLIVGEDNVPKYLDFEDTGKILNETAKTTHILGSSPTDQSPLEKPLLPAHQATGDLQIFSMQSTMIMKEEASPLLVQKRGVERPNVAAEATHGLSKAAKDRIHSYEKSSKITTSVVGVLRFGTIVMEAIHATAEAMNTDAAENEASPALLLPTLAVVGTGLGFAGSITQLCLYESARNYSKEVHDHLEEHNTSRTIGHTLGMIGNGSAFLAASFNRIAIPRKWVSPKASKGVSLVVSVLVSVGSYGEVIGVHLVPDAGEHTNVSTLSSVSDYTELAGTTCGLVTAFGSFAGGQGKVVAMATGTFDGIFTLVSLITETHPRTKQKRKGSTPLPFKYRPRRDRSIQPALPPPYVASPPLTDPPQTKGKKRRYNHEDDCASENPKKKRRSISGSNPPPSESIHPNDIPAKPSRDPTDVTPGAGQPLTKVNLATLDELARSTPSDVMKRASTTSERGGRKKRSSKASSSTGLNQGSATSALSSHGTSTFACYRWKILDKARIYVCSNSRPPPKGIQDRIDAVLERQISGERRSIVAAVCQKLCKEFCPVLDGARREDDSVEPIYLALSSLNTKGIFEIPRKTDWIPSLKPEIVQYSGWDIPPPGQSSSQGNKVNATPNDNLQIAETFGPAERPQDTMPPPPAPLTQPRPSNAILHTPRPDITVGINHSAMINAMFMKGIDEDQADGFLKFLQEQESLFSNPLQHEIPIRFPLLVVEGKSYSTGKFVFEAQSQAAVAGSCMLNLQLQLDELSKPFATDQDSENVPLAFSICTEGPHIELWAHYIITPPNGKRRYNMNIVKICHASLPAGVVDFFIDVDRILDWASSDFADDIATKLALMERTTRH